VSKRRKEVECHLRKGGGTKSDQVIRYHPVTTSKLNFLSRRFIVCADYLYVKLSRFIKLFGF